MTTRKDIEDFINSAPVDHQERLRRFQWRIDQELGKYKDPVQRFNKMVEMVWESVDRLQTALTEPSKLMDNRPKAEVVSLQPKRARKQPSC